MGFTNRTKKFQSDWSFQRGSLCRNLLGGKKDIDKAVSSAKAFNSWAYSSKEERLIYWKTIWFIKSDGWNGKTYNTGNGCANEIFHWNASRNWRKYIKSFKNILKDFKFERDRRGKNNQKLLYEPKGVCAPITPWNWPINQVNLKVIPVCICMYSCTKTIRDSTTFINVACWNDRWSKNSSWCF